jgi:hypothetical protein
MKKLFVMLALAWGTMGAFAQTETDSAAVVNKKITPVKEVYPQKEEDGDLYHGLTRKLTFDRMIPPYGLEVTYDKTTHIIFPSSVRYVDLGSPNLIAGKADGAREWIYDGYRMTIFSDKEEAVFEGSLGGDKLRYYPAKAMAQAGGSMQFVAPWQPGVVIDRELITGQNPFSDHALASAFIAALDKQQGAD